MSLQDISPKQEIQTIQRFQALPLRCADNLLQIRDVARVLQAVIDIYAPITVR